MDETSLIYHGHKALASLLTVRREREWIGAAGNGPAFISFA